MSTPPTSDRRGVDGAARTWSVTEVSVLEAVKTCCERWGMQKVTIDDIAKESGVSRATLYRFFPGGRDVVFEASRVYELDRFFTTLLNKIGAADTLEDLLVSTITCAIYELRNDEHLAIMLAAEPGEVVSEMTVEGLPRIIRVATAYLVPFVDPFLPRTEGRALIDIVARLVISYFLVPSDLVDLADEAAARAFIAPYLPASATSRSNPESVTT
jgi:AcrR family transcriptional regulator